MKYAGLREHAGPIEIVPPSAAESENKDDLRCHQRPPLRDNVGHVYRRRISVAEARLWGTPVFSFVTRENAG